MEKAIQLRMGQYYLSVSNLIPRMMLKRNIMPAMSNKKMPIPNETLDITSWLSKGLSKTSREKMKPRFAKNKKIYTQMWLNNAFLPWVEVGFSANIQTNIGNIIGAKNTLK